MPDEHPIPLSPVLASRRPALIDWFADRARDFPWRTRRTPYRVWISETMLQQTRAATVVPYFERWMDRFPTVDALARADVADVLAAWEGLGYYRRAHALHRAARTITHELGGRWPDDMGGWRALPGVGPYTAAAVTALAFGAPVVAVDGNVRRVGARLLRDGAPRDADVAAMLAPLLPASDPGRGTEALIELGATVCTPRAPACAACPLRPACAAAHAGDPEAYPTKRVRGPVPLRERWAVVALDPERGVWLERRPDDGLLAGLWGFPQLEERPAGRELDPIEQVYSHFRLRLRPVVVPALATEHGDRARWTALDALADLPLSRVDRRLMERLAASGLLAAGGLLASEA